MSETPNQPKPYISNEEMQSHMLMWGTTGSGRFEPGGIGLEPAPPPLPEYGCPDWVGDSIGELWNQTGVRLDRVQMTEMLYRTRIIDTIMDFGEVETQIRSDLANALSKDLIGADWPTYGDEVDMGEFGTRVHDAALRRGYSLTYDD